MNVISYFNPSSFERDNDGVLGLLADSNGSIGFYPITGIEFRISVSHPEGIKSASVQIDNGTFTLTKEFRKSGDRTKGYWYACKRIGGKLKRLYFGTEFTKDKLNAISDKLSQSATQPVTQEVTQEIVLAGHGKSEKHLRLSLMVLANDPVKVLKHKIQELERQNKDLNNRLIESLERVEKRNALIDSLEQSNKELNQVASCHSDLTNRLEKKIKTLQDDVLRLESESSKRDNDIPLSAHLLFEKPDRIFACFSLIEKYRAMIIDKTKKGNPRYAYLIDFLADIDKLS